MGDYSEEWMKAIKQRDMAVRAIKDFLEALDKHKVKAEIQYDVGYGDAAVETELVLPLTPPQQASSIQQLRMVVKSLGGKLPGA
jgi:hypothetical protein